VTALVDLFRWRSDGGLLRRAQSEFVSYQARALAVRLAQLEELDRALAGRIEELLALTPAAGVFRVLLAPEVTARLRLGLRPNLPVVGELLAGALETEAAAAGAPVSVSGPSWTALGDRLVLPSGKVRTPAFVECYPPIDVASPQARSIDPVTALCGDEIVRDPLANPECERLVEVLAEARQRIAAASPLADELIRGCGIVLVVVEQAGARLSSSTHGLHVGRITFASERWRDVPVEDVADALVHEAIHCLLLMLDYEDPLLLDDDAADELPPVESPWTGNPLPVPTYLHACFVWFGLAHFWRRARAADAFSPADSERLLERACTGFGRVPLLGPLDDEALRLVRPSAQSDLGQMQDLMTMAA
jgi:HEXXH motif-containing protein